MTAQAFNAAEYAEKWGVPEDAITRLNQMRERKLATSDLSVDELLLVRQAGFRPLGFVMGASVYRVPSYRYGNLGNMELTDYTQATYNMRQSALQRMEAEALLLGADGVVGVRFELLYSQFYTNGWEFMAYGTAVKADEAAATYPEVTWRNNKGLPFTSDLSGQAFWKLMQAGYIPCGFVMGNSVYHIGYQSWGGMLKRRNSIAEIPEYTQGIYFARELAMERMHTEAEALGAEVVAEFKLTQHGHGWDSHIMEFLSVGTAARALRADHHIAAPNMVVSLDQ